MKTAGWKTGIGVLLVAGFAAFPAWSGAQGDTARQRVVDGVEIYLGVVPAELARDHPRRHPERGMHDSSAARGYHVTVALFEQATGKRISDAEVSAQLVSPSHPEPAVRLEPMTIAGVRSYGNFFDLARGGTYRIDVQVRRPGRAEAIRASFSVSAN